MKVVRIYVANNGDVFFEHDGNVTELSELEIADLIESARKLYENLDIEIVNCKAVERDMMGIQFLSYRMADDSFIGEAGMHVRTEYCPIQNFVYLKRVSKRTKNNELAYIATNDLISVIDYAALHKVTPATVRQKILRGKLEAVKIGRDWMIGKDIPYTDSRKKNTGTK